MLNQIRFRRSSNINIRNFENPLSMKTDEILKETKTHLLKILKAGSLTLYYVFKYQIAHNYLLSRRLNGNSQYLKLIS
jgi:hypothetical protein